MSNPSFFLTSTNAALKPPSSFEAEKAPSHLIVSASFGRIIPDSVLSLFAPSRRLNIHPSLLPSYRGAAPIQHTLLNGETETGVAVIEMVERRKGLDSGGIWGMMRVVSPNQCRVVTN